MAAIEAAVAAEGCTEDFVAAITVIPLGDLKNALEVVQVTYNDKGVPTGAVIDLTKVGPLVQHYGVPVAEFIDCVVV